MIELDVWVNMLPMCAPNY